MRKAAELASSIIMIVTVFVWYSIATGTPSDFTLSIGEKANGVFGDGGK